MSNSIYTRKEVFEILLNLVEKSEKTLKDMGEHYEAICRALNTEIDRLDAQAEKRKNTPRKPTQKQKQNEALKKLLLHDIFCQNKAFRGRDIVESIDFDEEEYGIVNSQRIAALCSSLVKNNILVSVKQHNITYYSLPNVNMLESIKENEDFEEED